MMFEPIPILLFCLYQFTRFTADVIYFLGAKARCTMNAHADVHCRIQSNGSPPLSFLLASIKSIFRLNEIQPVNSIQNAYILAQPQFSRRSMKENRTILYLFSFFVFCPFSFNRFYGFHWHECSFFCNAFARSEKRTQQIQMTQQRASSIFNFISDWW